MISGSSMSLSGEGKDEYGPVVAFGDVVNIVPYSLVISQSAVKRDAFFVTRR